jgi:3-deoxy-7-phosphoheptulonate synthase
MDNKFPGKDISIDDLKSKIPLCAKKNKKHHSIVKVKNIEFGGKKIPILAGPNTVENLRMINKIGSFLKSIKICGIRGGAFKPLTFPYRCKKYYETKLDGLKWLKDTKNKHGLIATTEIMELKYLEDICNSTDIIQIGSRNMQNYPLLTECAKTQMPIMLKRHYGSSLRDWLGAAEYILAEGNKNVILCERGVSVPHTHRSSSRFLMDLQVIPAVKEICHLPIISDPSHATFWAPWVESMTLASIAAGCDGLLIEVHPDPKNAAVDPLQPLNFNQFKSLVSKSKKIAKCINRKIV